MADPLDVLLEPGGSTEPDPGFRRELMARVRAALDEVTDPANPATVPVVDATGVGDVHVVEIDHHAQADPGRRKRAWGLTLAAALVVAIGIGLLVQLAGRYAEDETPPSPVATVPPTSAAPPPPVTTAADVSCPNPEGHFANHCLGALDPGTYRTTTFEPSFTYTVPSGWWNTWDGAGNYVLLPPGESLSSFDMGTADYIGVYASVSAPAGCDEYPDPAVATTVEAYVAWLRSQSGLVVGEATPVVVGGLDGTQVDVALSDGPACSDPETPGAFVPVLLGTGPSLLGYEPGKRSDRVDATTRYRLMLFDRPDGTLMVIELADTGDQEGADSWWTTAAEITDTFQFEP